MSHEGYHEPYEKLPDAVRDMHRALVSLQEELEAVDWYYQRAATTTDAALREVLLHNAHEEIEHAMLLFEWIRRQDPVFDANMREYLFRDGSIVAVEAKVKDRESGFAPLPSPRRQAMGEPSIPADSRPVARTTLGSLRERGDR